MYTLRNYQKKMVDSIVSKVRQKPSSNVLCIGPCGCGKSIVIAQLTKEFHDKKILIITPRKKLLVQNAKYIPGCGICSGNYGFDTGENHQILLSTFQSLLARNNTEKFDIIIIDEVHLLSDDPETSRYAKFLEQHKNATIIGLTATATRGNTDLLDLKRKWIKAAEIEVMDLIRQGYLLPVRAISTGNDFSDNEIDQDELFSVTASALANALAAIKKNKRIRNLIFARSIEHAEFIYRKLIEAGKKNVYLVHSKQTTAHNDECFSQFDKIDKKTKWLINISIVTVGVDTNVDSIILLRHISSHSLFTQALGRGQRRNDGIGKIDCLLLDYGANIGTYKNIIPNYIPKFNTGSKTLKFKSCPDCETLNTTAAKNCYNCGLKFRFKTKLSDVATFGDVLPSAIKAGVIKESRCEAYKEIIKATYTLREGDECSQFIASESKLLTAGSRCVYEITKKGNFILSYERR